MLSLPRRGEKERRKTPICDADRQIIQNYANIIQFSSNDGGVDPDSGILVGFGSGSGFLKRVWIRIRSEHQGFKYLLRLNSSVIFIDQSYTVLKYQFKLLTFISNEKGKRRILLGKNR